MKRLLALIVVPGVLATLALSSSAAPTADQKKAKEKLQDLHDFIGQWNGNGAPAKARPAPNELWKEIVNVGWKFKGDDAWMVLEFKDSKNFKSAELRYLPAKNKYELTVVNSADKKLVFLGDIKNEQLTLERVDAESKQTQQLVMNTAAEGVRMNYRFSTKADGSTIYKDVFKVAAGREGQSLAAREKKTLCVVSGGLGTIPVTYKGETYYVCCSGCKEAFLETPEKYIAEFKAKKGK